MALGISRVSLEELACPNSYQNLFPTNIATWQDYARLCGSCDQKNAVGFILTKVFAGPGLHGCLHCLAAGVVDTDLRAAEGTCDRRHIPDTRIIPC
jgi:hypothetical protein